MEFKGTKGKWKIGTHFSNIVTDEKTERPSYSEENYESEKKYYGGYLVCESVSKKADAKLIAAAPEMFEMLKETKSTISRLKNSMRAHPDCEEHSEFFDYVNLADEKETKIEHLLIKITQ